ncbi:MAG: HAD-IA family hydrolase [Aliiglaciecola sp.]|uniref:HAD family hydrolase n=1 Tax=Aliiglaciecola sp. M165 TaxID=2593649 RepID=UPI00117E0CFB|nr:HAD-IA family hydrolase [Aliiglaciecola sp. M165]TRY30171.1 HAD-IA family hydrolase [Aliiglaciecola sp. M165]
MSSFSGVLFDLDGTLLDTAPDLGNALNHVLDHYGFPTLAYEQYRIVASDGAKGLLQLGTGDQFDHIDYEKARQKLLDYYFENICVDTQPFDGVDETLRYLNQQSIPWGIVTNKPGWLTAKLLKHFPLMEECRCVISGDTYEFNKPHPLPLIEASRILNVSPEQVLYVGDAKRDIDAAHAAQMRSVVALYGYISDLNEGKSWGAEFEIQIPTDILNHF